jgi:hypothetical protein
MAFKCNTTQTKVWTSTIKQTTPDGTVSIDLEDGKGRFKGKHDQAGHKEDIRGGCHSNGIWFLLPAVNPQFLYSGTFTDDETIEGFRVTLGATAAAGDDDWVATRGPTLLNKSVRGTYPK